MYWSWEESLALALAASVSYTLGLLARLGAEEGRIIGALAVDQRDEAEVGKLLFPPVRDGDLRGALERHIPLVGPEGVDRQPLHQAAAFHSPDRGASSGTWQKASVRRAPRA